MRAFSAMRAGSGRLRQDDVPVLHAPAQQDLGDRPSDAAGDVRQDRVIQPPSVGERAVGLDDDAVLPAERRGVAPLQERRQLDLIDGGDVPGGAEQLVQVRHQKVADADRPGALLLVEALQRPPGVQPLAGDRPVEQVEVDVVQAQALQTGVEGAQRAVVALVVVPELGRHEQLLARDAAGANAGADVCFIAVDARGVDVAVADAQRLQHRLARRRAGRCLPDAQPNLRNHGARIQRDRGGRHVGHGQVLTPGAPGRHVGADRRPDIMATCASARCIASQCASRLAVNLLGVPSAARRLAAATVDFSGSGVDRVEEADHPDRRREGDAVRLDGGTWRRQLRQSGQLRPDADRADVDLPHLRRPGGLHRRCSRPDLHARARRPSRRWKRASRTLPTCATLAPTRATRHACAGPVGLLSATWSPAVASMPVPTRQPRGRPPWLVVDRRGWWCMPGSRRSADSMASSARPKVSVACEARTLGTARTCRVAADVDRRAMRPCLRGSNARRSGRSRGSPRRGRGARQMG